MQSSSTSPSVEKADLIVFALPLYNDSLPHLVSYALQMIAAWKAPRVNVKAQHLVVIANNGFPARELGLL